MKIKGENLLIMGGLVSLVLLASMDKRLMRGGNFNKNEGLVRKFIEEKITMHGLSGVSAVEVIYEQFRNDPHEFLSELDDWLQANYGVSLTQQGYFANVDDAAAEEMRIVERAFKGAY